MKGMKIGLALVAAFAITAVAAASASAAPVWKLNGVEIKEAVSVKSKSVGKLKLSDTGAGTEIECEGTDKGKVGPGGKDEVIEITATGCSFVSAKNGSCEASKPVTAKAVNLPWVTELYEPEVGKIRDHIRAHSGGGAPGWVVECTVAGFFKVQDECTGESNTAMSNVTGGVDAIFDATTPKANCSIGGTGTGKVEGTDLNENPVAGTITVA
jgi:hypothetical protein